MTKETAKEQSLRALWTSLGVAPEKQDELLAMIAEKAKPGAFVGPFRIPMEAPDHDRPPSNRSEGV